VWPLLVLGCGTSHSSDSEPRDGEARAALSAEDEWEGTLRVTVVDPPTGEGMPRLEEYLELADGSYVEIDRAATAAGESARSGEQVRVFGRLAGNRIEAGRLERLDVLPYSDDDVLEAVVPRETLATKKIAVLLVSLPNATNNFNPDQVRSAVFGATGRSSRTFWEEGSFGKLTITGHLRQDGDVFGPYSISGDCGYGNVVNASAQAAMAAGVDLSPYDHVVRYTPAGASGCPGGGQGDQPGRNSIIYGIGINALWDYVGHEVGHNFGCGHASSYDNCALGAFAGSCQHNEYGDQTDIMGGRNGHYMSYYKNAMGWLDPGNHSVVTASRRVRLYPIETASTGLQSVLIPRGDNTQFHLEFRQAVGYDSFLETGLTNGVLLRYLPSGNGHSR
jgi:hypothetical protein